MLELYQSSGIVITLASGVGAIRQNAKPFGHEFPQMETKMS